MIFSIFKRRKFNCRDQSTATWWQRADVCADLIQELARSKQPVVVADLGCGDEKLKDVLSVRKLDMHYRGFDLHPQHKSIATFDVRSDVLDDRSDFVTLMGVLDYMDDPGYVLSRLSGMTDCIVFSYVLNASREYSAEQIQALNWKARLSEVQLLQLVREVGLEILAKRLTPDGRTLVVAARARSNPEQ